MQHTKTPRRRPSGFTLIELSIALVIIAILMAGILPLARTYMISSQNAALNSAFETIKANVALNAVNFRQIEEVCVGGPAGCPGGACASQCATYPSVYPISETGEAAINDPWSQPIQYEQKSASVSAGTMPGAAMFTLTSNGPDGVAGTGDEITRTITAAELLVLIAKMGLGG